MVLVLFVIPLFGLCVAFYQLPMLFTPLVLVRVLQGRGRALLVAKWGIRRWTGGAARAKAHAPGG